MSTTERPTHFLAQIIEGDLEKNTHDGRVQTRFPPEPNGYLHIGHAKAICVSFGLAEAFGGACNLRFDDTNPEAEDTEYVEAIKEDVKWLGFEWSGEARFASNYFETFYGWAVSLIEAGKAYVDSQTVEQIRAGRGTAFEPGTPGPYRDRSVAENLDLFARMRAGEFVDGEHVLRAKIDLTAANILMRDPLLYRIRHATHHRTGDNWCIYPMYDYAHCLEDAIEGITHSICTLEFENNRAIYDWLIANCPVPHTPRQYEFARLSLAHTVMSKRKLLQLVKEGRVMGWDDPRMPTLAGLRRRGVPAAAIRQFCDMIGVAKANSLVDLEKFDYCVRDRLNHEAPRVMAVLDPLPLTLTNVGDSSSIDADYWPHDVPREGTRSVAFGARVLIEQSDFAEQPPAGWKRLAPGRCVRLRHGPVVICDEVVRDAAGAVVELRGRAAEEPGARAIDGVKAKGALHWVSADHHLDVPVRLVDRLFSPEQPGRDPDVAFLDELNPDSMPVVRAAVEVSLADAPGGSWFQFERVGYFFVDPVDRASGKLVFNRVVELRDSWGKKAAVAEAPVAAKPPVAASQAKVRERSAEARAGSAALVAAHGVSEQNAERLWDQPLLGELFGAMMGAGAPAKTAAKWTINHAASQVADGVGQLTGANLAELAAAVDAGHLAGRSVRPVLSALHADGGDVEGIIDRLGLRIRRDDGALAAAIDAVLAEHAEAVERYRNGEAKLIGLFIGQVMRRCAGAADPKSVRSGLLERLNAI
jgi:glutaminyl-tRNA synthetase